jgi:hypothetical protein
VRVSTINDDISLLEEGLELTDEVVNGLTGLDEENDSPGLGERAAELLDRVGTDNVGSCSSALLKKRSSKQLTLSLVLEESIDLGGGSISSAFSQRLNVCDLPVVGTDLETLVVHVEDQVLTLYVGR